MHQECLDVFKLDILSKVNKFAKVDNNISLGLRSHLFARST